MRKILWQLISVALISLTAATPAFCKSDVLSPDDIKTYSAGTGSVENYHGEFCDGTQIAQMMEVELTADDGHLEGSGTSRVAETTRSGEVRQQQVNATLAKLIDTVNKNESSGAYQTIRKYTQEKKGSETGNDGTGTGNEKDICVTKTIWQAVYDDKAITDKGVYQGQTPPGGDGDDEKSSDKSPCVIGYMNNGDIVKAEGNRMVVAPNTSEECAKDANACTDAERGLSAEDLLKEIEKMVKDENPVETDETGGTIVPEGKWIRGNEGSWTPPSREYVPNQKTTRWGVEYAGITVGIDLDLAEGGTASNTVHVGSDTDYITATLTATVHYEIVHDKTDYLWNIEQPDGTWFSEDHHVLEQGETVRLELMDAGTYRVQTIPRHYYHVNRYVSYTVEGIHHYEEAGDPECVEVPDPNDPSKTIPGDCVETIEVFDVGLGTVSDVKTDLYVHSGTIMDYDNQQWHTYDNPPICVGCPGIFWCVGCEPEVCDDNKRYVCDDNVNELGISPYSFLTE